MTSAGLVLAALLFSTAVHAEDIKVYIVPPCLGGSEDPSNFMTVPPNANLRLRHAVEGGLCNEVRRGALTVEEAIAKLRELGDPK